MRDGREVLSQIHLHLTERRIGLIGDNGAGKSSFFRVICGLDRPTKGEVRVESAAREHAARTVGMMFQNPDDMIICPVVVDEIALALTARNVRRAAAHAQARDLLCAHGLLHWADLTVASLSQGQKQYVCWLSLRLAGHGVLLLDEPYASLDLPSQRRLRREVDRASATAQILVSTHTLEHLADFDRVIWLEAGKIRADGPAASVCNAYLEDLEQRSGSMRHGNVAAAWS